MSFNVRLILLLCFLTSPIAHASDIFIEPLYWRITQPIDWVYFNSATTPSQTIAYQTTTFHFTPGFRVGANFTQTNWDSSLYYTQYSAKTADTAQGNLVSGLLGSKLVQASATPTFFYTAGHVQSSIDYHMLDWNIGKCFAATEKLSLHPVIGLEGGVVNQSLDSYLQGSTSATENVKQRFKGLGPKIGIESTINLLQHVNLVANFYSAYLLGYWEITDKLHTNLASNVDIDVANRNLGTMSLQGLLGLQWNYKQFSVRAGYEITDWFNECQIFDDATGAHDNDLILQGLSLKISYRF
jgi:hypothetical protein